MIESLESRLTYPQHIRIINTPNIVTKYYKFFIIYSYYMGVENFYMELLKDFLQNIFSRDTSTIWYYSGTSLRGYCTPDLELACLCYLKTINTFLINNICMHLKVNCPRN